MVLVSAVIPLGSCLVTPDESPSVPLRILAINDFHGNIQSEKPSPGRLPLLVDGKEEMVEAGGAAYLAAHIARERIGHANSILVSAGDLTGASPLISSLLKDEPTIRIMNLIGLDFNVVGNHEFDYGRAELLRKAQGGCHGQGDCREGDFAGARFRYLAANVVDAATGESLFPAYELRIYDGVQVAFIGVVTDETPYIVAADGIRGLHFLDEAETLNRHAAELREQGVRAIIAILHEGGAGPADLATDGSPCVGLEGAIRAIMARADPEIDLFISGHTHQGYACRQDGRLVTQAASYGRMMSVIDLALSRTTGDVEQATATNLPVLRDLAPDAAIEAELDSAATATAPIRLQPVAVLAAPLSRTPDAAGESALGDVIADAHLAAARLLGAEFAVTNPGGIRQDLPSDPAAGLEVTLGDLFAAQPFGNGLVALNLTGAQVKTLLEQQWLDQPTDRKPRILQVSDGFSYCYDERRADGDKVVTETLRLSGQPLDPTRTYRLVVNAFLADGGDRFSVLKEGTERVQGGSDLDALRTYLSARAGSLVPQSQGRICRLG